VVLGDRSAMPVGAEDALWESAWWGGDVDRAETAQQAPPPLSRLFPHAGLAVCRTEAACLLITNARVGTAGFGNHKHNDLLSFEFHAHGTPLIVDPGSYLYTSDPGARNLFRSTRYHSTVSVDGVEQNDL